MHRVSDQLNDRHPYQDLPFQESYNSKEVARAFGARAIPKYAELLVMDDLTDEERTKALQDLNDLLSNQETKYTAGAQEIVFSCADLTESHCESIRASAALVISSLVLLENSTADELSNETMLRAATALLRDSEESVVVAACTIFRNATISNEGVILVASKEAVIERLTSMITSQPLSHVPAPVLTLLLEILSNLTRVYEGARACNRYPIIDPVVTILKKCVLYPPQMLLHAALVIGNAATHDHGKREAIRLHAVEICLRVLAKVLSKAIACEVKMQVELTRCLIGAVMGLSTSEDAKPHVIEFGIEPLVACLHHSQAAVKTNAMIAINSACESPLGITHFTQKLLPERDLLIEVLGHRAIPALNACLSRPDEDDQLCALRVLEQLSQREDGLNHFIQCLDLLDHIARFVPEPQPHEVMRDLAIRTLKTIAKSGPGCHKRIERTLLKQSVASADCEAILQM